MLHNQSGDFHVFLNGRHEADLNAEGLDANVVADLAVILKVLTPKQKAKCKVFGYINGNPLCWSIVQGRMGNKVNVIEFVRVPS